MRLFAFYIKFPSVLLSSATVVGNVFASVSQEFYPQGDVHTPSPQAEIPHPSDRHPLMQTPPRQTPSQADAPPPPRRPL